MSSPLSNTVLIEDEINFEDKRRKYKNLRLFKREVIKITRKRSNNLSETIRVDKNFISEPRRTKKKKRISKK